MSVKLSIPGGLRRKALDTYINRREICDYQNKYGSQFVNEEILKTPECAMLLTQLRNMEERIQKNEERFQTFVDSMLDCFAVYSAVRDKSGKITDFLLDYVNDAACHNFKMTREEQIGRSILELRPLYKEAGIFNEFCLVANRGVPLVREKMTYEDPVKKIIYGMYDIRAVKLGDGIAVTWRDITEHKKTEEALRHSEERFYKIFHTSSIIQTLRRLEDFRYIDVNLTFERVLGYSLEESLGRSCMDLNLWPEVEDRQKYIREIKKHGIVRNMEVKLRAKSGEIRIGLLSADVIALGGEQCVLTNSIDITEKKQLEIEMARLERFNLVGEMAAGIAHEIRNPMTAVKGFLQYLSGKKDCVQYKEYYDLMILELDRANAIISEFLSIARSRAVELKHHNLNDIIESLYPLIQADAMVSDKEIKIELGEIINLNLDEKEIRQLILNLFRNGMEAMQPGKHLTIKTCLDNGKVVLSVQDQGTGIDPEVLKKLGTPFFTTKEKGTGLGLAVCYSIAARHNATIKVKTGSEGTTFFVRFAKQ
ncbi:Sporulation kinase E [Pelotomaculum schinkii]|uniref:histidine kinase n=1 Tax=Pelotomaculum schinkii TaxID=78350 RepID=A0A4Y7REF4_9FIRM|nr:PAS domain-containing sensor histidine kinase [Pelotomaculum schinkii]TEB07169.1 Sporulation kinase E [Pelotomaculum schinkii]